jgi:Co/Zn/Cd efflux system component
VTPGADHEAVLVSIQHLLRERFGIDHATIQIETAACTGP